ncbi:SDR family oxidoreductase [Streptomyces sp. SID8358]|uniref:SDR family NAD(P)-dependent oxidoreductase n=1 Tax=Streptomyces sp. SID8358 TaxID=2690342 RepID=UPI000DAD3FB8|nr:SDR family oxidoreductase [Streptomyces sp. SID8358]MYU36149.1 SDR family oxidoreductase [Streptomyces sp. SID8358]
MRHVLVTGAAGGIGRAIAEEFAADGAALTLADRDRTALDRVAERLGASANGPVGALTVDLTDPQAPEDLVQRAWKARGPVDVLVNAAGVYPSLDMADVSAADWDRLFAVNLRAPVLATAAFARLAVEHGRGGAVVHISSGSALRARPGGGPYASSKAALEMATRAAALELGVHGIRVNAVSPGFVPVDSACNPVSEQYAAAIGANPLGRAGTPRDIARAVRWIAGPDASWITGEILRVDGGSSTGALHLPRIWPPDGPRLADGGPQAPTHAPAPVPAPPAQAATEGHSA